MINKIFNEDCIETMAGMSDNFIDLTVTSPPYDKLRKYETDAAWNSTVWKSIIDELYRVTKEGGVVVWVVGDATVDGSESGTSFEQALYFKSVGFKLHDTMIYLKNRLAFPDKTRYYNAFEYMFVFCKGKIKTFNPIKDRKNVSAGDTVHGCERLLDGSMKKERSGRKNVIKEFGVRWNYWLMHNWKPGVGHPAPFPEQLVNDHIISWSNEDDLIYDPMMGSGTVLMIAKRNNRNYIGSEISKKYCDLARERIK